MFFLTGVARFLFVPLAEAVVFAMLASYLLSRTLVPTLVDAADAAARTATRAADAQAEPAAAPLPRASTARFERVRARLHAGCSSALLAQRGRLRRRRSSASACCRWPALPGARPRLLPDASTPARSACTCARPTGTRIEETARLADQVEARDPRASIPRDELDTHPRQPRRAQQRHQPVATATPAPSAPLDGEILIVAEARATGRPRTSCARCAPSCPSAFPASSSSSSRPTSSRRSSTSACPPPIDVQFSGNDMARQRGARAPSSPKAIRQIPGAVDVHVHQRLDAPGARASRWTARGCSRCGLSRATSASNLLVVAVGQLADARRPSGSNPQNGVVYSIAVQTPQYTRRLARRAARTSRSARRGAGAGRSAGTQLLGNLVDAQARASRRSSRTTTSRRLIDVYVQRAGHRPRPASPRRSQKLVDEMRPKLPRGSQVDDARPGARPCSRRSSASASGLRDGDRARLPADRRQLPVVARRRSSSSPRCPPRWPASRGCCSSPARR